MSDLEAAFDYYWRALDGPELAAEVRINPARGWKFDRLHVLSKVVIELEGGTWSGGRHVRGQGFEDDCVKYNWASRHHYAVFRLTGTMVRNAPAEHLTPIIDLIYERMDGYGADE